MKPQRACQTAHCFFELLRSEKIKYNEIKVSCDSYTEINTIKLISMHEPGCTVSECSTFAAASRRRCSSIKGSFAIPFTRKDRKYALLHLTLEIVSALISLKDDQTCQE